MKHSRKRRPKQQSYVTETDEKEIKNDTVFKRFDPELLLI